MADRSVSVTNRKDILLLLLYSPGDGNAANVPIEGRTRVVKMAYLFQQEIWPTFKKGLPSPAEEFYRFFAYDFGPYSVEVMDDIEFFRLRGFIRQDDGQDNALPEEIAEYNQYQSEYEDADEAPEFRPEVFTLTERGVEFAAALYDSLTAEQRADLDRFKAKMTASSLRSILRYVYVKYPKMTEESTIRDQILH